MCGFCLCFVSLYMVIWVVNKWEVRKIKQEWIYLALHTLSSLCATIGFAYGAKLYYKKRKPLFAQLIVSALGCFAFSHLHAVVSVLTAGTIPDGFHLGKMGFIGGVVFLFSASYGQMDGLADDKSPKNRKYKFAALAAPAVLFIGFVAVLLSGAGLVTKIFAGVQFAIMMQCSYYLLKHLLIPDIELGIIRAVREYLIATLCLTAFLSLFVISEALQSLALSDCAGVLLCRSGSRTQQKCRNSLQQGSHSGTALLSADG